MPALELEPGMDFRLPEYRREVFLRFYLHSARFRNFPGAVYYILPSLRQRFGWSDEEALWFAFLNGNTQHPVTSLVLHQICPEPSSPRAVRMMLAVYRARYALLPFDTDRRHWKKSLPEAVESYVAALRPHGGSQHRMWLSAADRGFAGVWEQATALYGFGRLSAFSYAEYLRIMGVPFDCDTLLLADKAGSRSHRNGLCIVTGRDHLDWHPSNPHGFDGNYSPAVIGQLEEAADDILAEARQRATGEPWADDLSLFTLESALCTYKGWHRVNRRYPNVYNDMLYDRLKAYETKNPSVDLEPFWAARRQWLPAHLRLEDNPGDPGCVAVKQNHYRLTGQVIMMAREYPAFANDFEDAVAMGAYGLRRDLTRQGAPA